MARLRYEIDPHNRLIIGETGKKTGIYRFRHVVEGRFKTGKDNVLIYHIKASSSDAANELNLPHQLKLKGNWSLTREHNLRLTLNKWRRQTFGDELTLKGEIIKADAHSLVFAVTQRTKENVTSIYILRFEGSWQADRNNRLAFRMRKEKGRHDMLAIDGIWEINRNNRIVYRYEKRAAKYDRRKTKHSLLFNGFWNLTERDILTYRMDLKGKSAFNFRIGRGIFQKSAIKFEIGIGLSRRQRPVRRDIILYGRWKIKKGAGLIFEMRYAGGRLYAMKFQADARLVGKTKIKFTLKNESGKGLGLAVTLSGTFLKGGESFIRFLSNRKEKAVYIGTGFKW